MEIQKDFVSWAEYSQLSQDWNLSPQNPYPPSALQRLAFQRLSEWMWIDFTTLEVSLFLFPHLSLVLKDSVPWPAPKQLSINAEISLER